MCCCPEDTNDGRPASGGGDGEPASAFVLSFPIVGAVTVTTPLVDLPAGGASALFRDIAMTSWVTAGYDPGGFGVSWNILQESAQRNSLESFVYGPPAGGSPVVNAGYLAPGAVGAAGYGAVQLAIVANQVVLQVTGIAGFTVQVEIRGDLWVFGGATRLVA